MSKVGCFYYLKKAKFLEIQTLIIIVFAFFYYLKKAKFLEIQTLIIIVFAFFF